MSAHPQDKLAALDWVIAMAQQSPHRDSPLGSLYLAALREMRDEAQREARSA